MQRCLLPQSRRDNSPGLCGQPPARSGEAQRQEIVLSVICGRHHVCGRACAFCDWFWSASVSALGNFRPARMSAHCRHERHFGELTILEESERASLRLKPIEDHFEQTGTYLPHRVEGRGVGFRENGLGTHPK